MVDAGRNVACSRRTEDAQQPSRVQGSGSGRGLSGHVRDPGLKTEAMHLHQRLPRARSCADDSLEALAAQALSEPHGQAAEGVLGPASDELACVRDRSLNTSLERIRRERTSWN